jgi:aryl-alcohol dehydrogenase-like predicted oxidoreductase
MMKYITIPGTTLKPAVICLGSTHIGSTIDQVTSFNLFDIYLEQGGNFIDTASVYANWLPVEKSISEKTIGRWLRQRGCRDQVILATKGAHPELSTMHIPRLSRAEIVQDLHDSLKNLQTERIDLYWLHRDDPTRPVEDILETLNDQVRAGKIRYFGCSNWRTERISTAQAYAASHELQGFVANQMMWSLALPDLAGIKDKTIAVMDEAMQQYHLETGLAATPYSSQANGLFQKMAQGTLAQMDSNRWGVYQAEANRQRGERIKRLAAETGLSVTQIVLGYLHSQPFPTIPIVGCRTPNQLQDSLTAADISLDPDHLNYLEYGD